ncbi:MAG: hypothetical protein U1D30_22030 [Planctomycetota bacterium]
MTYIRLFSRAGSTSRHRSLADSRSKWLRSFAAFMVLLALGRSAAADFIDFDGLSLAEGDSVPVIDGVTFNAAIAIPGGSAYAFFSPFGADTVDPTSAFQGAFITNNGGFSSPETVKTIEITFAMDVRNLSFLLGDIDSGGGVIERFTANAFDVEGILLDTRIVVGPTGSTNGDGTVSLVDFGDLSRIRSLVLTVDNAGEFPEYSDLGFGIDNLSFTPVPEASSLAMAFVGISTLALTMRNRRVENATRLR